MQTVEKEQTEGTEIMEKYRAICSNEILCVSLDAMPIPVVIIDQDRLVVYANQALLDQIDLKDRERVIGKYFGELFGCQHVINEQMNCGSTKYCRYCGAMKTLVSSIGGVATTQDCRLLVRKGDIDDALNLKITSSKLEVNGYNLNILSVEDNSSKVRRTALERIFFHDVLNTAYAVSSGIDLVFDEDENTPYFQEIKDALPLTAKRLIEEIQIQRQLVLAEQDELEVEPYKFNAKSLIDEVLKHIRNYQRFNKRVIMIEPDFEDVAIYTDKTLLVRVMFNMVKNALEAGNGLVKIGCKDVEDKTRISVYNPEVIPENVRYQLFQPSFSTKESGRGFGTYSIKLLTERYLAGKVGFTSSEDSGTEFFIVIPHLTPEFR